MLRGQKVLIIGGASGIGLAVAKQVARQRGKVIIASRSASEQKDILTNAIEGQVELHAFDITSDDYSRLFSATGKIDHLIITARPPLQTMPFIQTDIGAARSAFEIKFWGQYRLVMAALSFLNLSGSVILTSGIAGEKIYRGATLMAVMNSATETLGRALAVELAPVRVNVVSPGFVLPKPKEVEEHAQSFPVRRLACAEEIAETFLHLMTNSYITGTTVVVDGGARLV